MRLGDLEFPGFVMNASGARGFFGEGYRFPHPGALADWRGSIFVSKTCTLNPRVGNMPLKRDGVTPRERIPRSIITNFSKRHVLNCVSLSNDGFPSLLAKRRWSQRRDPYVISFMAVAETREERMSEWRQFLELFTDMLRLSLADVICEVNIGCPNTDHDPKELVGEVHEMLDIAGAFNVKVIVNINLLVSPREAVEISRHANCAAVSQSNSIPWDYLPTEFRRKMFGSETSPLVRRGFGPGGYSGPYALDCLLEWTHEARMLDQGRQWLIVGGGIQSIEDAEKVCRTGFKMLLGIKLGIVCIVRPWEVQRIIRHVNAYFEGLDRSRLHVVHSERPGMLRMRVSEIARQGRSFITSFKGRTE